MLDQPVLEDRIQDGVEQFPRLLAPVGQAGSQEITFISPPQALQRLIRPGRGFAVL